MNKSSWQPTRAEKYPRLKKNQHFDVVIIGGGITGLSAAFFLKQAGKTVCVLERDRIGDGDTGHTTAHLTAVTDLRISKLVKYFGEEAGRLVCQAGRTSIDAIESIAREHEIECEFQRVPGFLCAPLTGGKREQKTFEQEAELARRLGMEARFVETVPYVDRPGVLFADQAKFHPLKYLSGLAQAVHGDGCVISESTEVTEIKADPLAVEAGKLRLECGYVVIATHVPLMGHASMASAALFQTKLSPYSTYAISAKLPRGNHPEISLWDTSNPYYYLRVDRLEGGDRAILGGEDHKTGQAADTEIPFERLASVLASIFPAARIDRRWSGQVIETNDGLPYIGETAEHQFAATGFSGNGMTFGTVAGMMARDRVCQRRNPWQGLFAVDRKKIRGGTWNYLQENVDYPYYFWKDRLVSAEGTSVREVGRGEGKILKIDGRRVGLFAGRKWSSNAVGRRVHSHGLRSAVEWIGTDLGLPLPRIALSSGRRGAGRPGGNAAEENFSTRQRKCR